MYDRMKAMFSGHKQPPMPPSDPVLISTVPYGAVPNIPYESSSKLYQHQPLPAGFDRTAVPGQTPAAIAGGPSTVAPGGAISALQPVSGPMDRTRIETPKTPAKLGASATASSTTLPGLPETALVKPEAPTPISAANSPANKKVPFTGLVGRRADDHPAFPVVAEMPATPPESQAAKANPLWQTGIVDPKLFSNGSKLAFPAPQPGIQHPSIAATPTIDKIEPTPDRWKGLFYLKRETPSTPMPMAPSMTYAMGYPTAMPGAMMPMNAFHNVTPPPPFNAFGAPVMPPVMPAAYGYPTPYGYAATPMQPVNYEQTAPGNPTMDRPFSAAPPQGDRKLLAELLKTAKESPHPSQREWAVMSLATYNIQAHPHLVSFLSQVALNDAAGAVRASAVTSLKRMNVPAQTIYTTLQSLRHDTDVRVRTAVEEACEAR
jgi:hypothetical protein